MMKCLIVLLFMFLSNIVYGQTMQEKLISAGAWFLFSSRIEQSSNNSDEILAQIIFYKKDDVSSLLFDKDNKIYSVNSNDGADMNEDVWKIVNDSSFIMAAPDGTSAQIFEIMEFSPSKLVLRYYDDSDENITMHINTFFPTKKGWLSDKEIDDLNSVGVIEIESMTP